MAGQTPKPRRAAPRSGRREIAGESRKRGRILAAAVLAGFVAAVVITTRNTLRTEAAISSETATVAAAHAAVEADADTAWVPTTDPLWPEIREVAENFLCGCGDCGDMELVECECAMEDGGIAEKRFIRDLLEAGLTPSETVPLVERRFGRRIQSDPGLDS